MQTRAMEAAQRNKADKNFDPYVAKRVAEARKRDPNFDKWSKAFNKQVAKDFAKAERLMAKIGRQAYMESCQLR